MERIKNKESSAKKYRNDSLINPSGEFLKSAAIWGGSGFIDTPPPPINYFIIVFRICNIFSKKVQFLSKKAIFNLFSNFYHSGGGGGVVVNSKYDPTHVC